MAAETILTCLSLLAVDGDTVRCDGRNLRPMGDGAPFVSGFDTPETHPHSRCALENHLGILATARMSTLLNERTITIVSSGQFDNFDRELVWLRLDDGGTIGEILMEEGHAARWSPDYKANWCDEY